MTISKLTTITAATLTAVFVTGCSLLPQPQPELVPEVSVVEQEVQGVPNVVVSATASGQTAFEVVNAQAEIEATDFGDAGMFITSINGVAADDTHYWALYVNGEYSQTGVSQTTLAVGEEIVFKYEEVDTSAF